MYEPKTGADRGYLIAELPDHERPRERLARLGAESLSDAELLAIMLGSGRRGRSALELARDLLREAGGSLTTLATQDQTDLQTIAGVGPAKAAQINAAFTLAKRLSSTLEPATPRLEAPAQVAELMRELFRGKQQEEFHALLINTKHSLIRDVCITVGLLDRSPVHAREVFRPAIRESCSRIILTHNHPSGDPTPSSEDIASTKKLSAAGKIVGIEILDHVIVGAATEARTRDYLSFREENLL